jgi:hypothetical protein
VLLQGTASANGAAQGASGDLLSGAQGGAQVATEQPGDSAQAATHSAGSAQPGATSTTSTVDTSASNVRTSVATIMRSCGCVGRMTTCGGSTVLGLARVSGMEAVQTASNALDFDAIQGWCPEYSKQFQG